MDGYQLWAKPFGEKLTVEPFVVELERFHYI